MIGNAHINYMTEVTLLGAMKESLLVPVTARVKTEAEMHEALKTLPITRVPEQYKPSQLFEFRAKDPLLRNDSPIGTFVIVQYKDQRTYSAYESHFFGEDGHYERYLVVVRDRRDRHDERYVGKWLDLGQSITEHPPAKLEDMVNHIKFQDRTRAIVSFATFEDNGYLEKIA